MNNISTTTYVLAIVVLIAALVLDLDMAKYGAASVGIAGIAFVIGLEL